MQEILDYVKGNSTFGNFKREGIVFKSLKPIDGKIISFKAINNEYLLIKDNNTAYNIKNKIDRSI